MAYSRIGRGLGSGYYDKRVMYLWGYYIIYIYIIHYMGENRRPPVDWKLDSPHKTMIYCRGEKSFFGI